MFTGFIKGSCHAKKLVGFNFKGFGKTFQHLPLPGECNGSGNLPIKYSYTKDIRDDTTVASLMGYKLDFTTGERAGAAALNLVFGSGSFFLQKDIFGGSVTAGIEAVGAGLLIAGVVRKASDADKAKSAEGYGFYDGGPLPMILMIGGGAVYAGGAVFGIVRALHYQRPGASTAVHNPLPMNIDLVSDTKGNPALQLSYTLHF